MQNLIKTVVAIIAVAVVVVGPQAVSADDGYDFGYYPSDSYSGYDSYDYYPSDSYSGYDSYDYYPSDSYSGYDSYDYYPSDSYSGYDSYDYYPSDSYSGYDSYDYYPSDSYSGYDSFSGYDYSGYDAVSSYPSYGSYGGAYLPYGNSGCVGGCQSGGSLGLSYSNSERSTRSNYNSSVRNNYNYSNTSTVNNTRTDTTCSNGTNCNTVYNQVAATDTSNSFTGTCATSGSYNIGQSVVWTASATGGSGSYTYTWSGDVSGTGQTITQTYNSTGTRNATVTITSGNQSITRSCSVNIQSSNYNNNNLSVSCPTAGNYNVGQQVTWSANAYGGNGNYTYYWSGAVNGYGNYLTASYSYPGTQYATVRVNDGSGNSVTQSCQINITGSYYGGTTYTPPGTGVLTSGVLLSSIPFTGLGYGMKMTLFVLGMILWSAFMAWVIMRKKLVKKGISHSDMIAKFKADNLSRKQVVA